MRACFMSIFQGTRIWVPDQDIVWAGAELLKDTDGAVMELLLEDGSVSQSSCLNK